jgi:formate hydrogenlyase subunit 4
VILALLVGLFVPWGIAATPVVSVSAVTLAFVFYVMKVLGLAIAIALVESSVAKLRMYLVPNLLGVAGGLGVLAVIFTVLMR